MPATKCSDQVWSSRVKHGSRDHSEARLYVKLKQLVVDLLQFKQLGKQKGNEEWVNILGSLTVSVEKQCRIVRQNWLLN